jgi:hypothetical protein
MSFRTDPQRTAIARDLLAAMLQGACSAQVNPMYLSAVLDGVLNSPKLAVQLTDKLITELEREEAKP